MYRSSLFSEWYLFTGTADCAFSGLLADMYCICFPEWVMAVWAGEITFGPFIRADGHGEIGKRVAFTPDFELLVLTERCPFYVNLFSDECVFNAFEYGKRDLRRAERACQVGVRVNQHFPDVKFFQPLHHFCVALRDHVIRDSSHPSSRHSRRARRIRSWYPLHWGRLGHFRLLRRMVHMRLAWMERILMTCLSRSAHLLHRS